MRSQGALASLEGGCRHSQGVGKSVHYSPGPGVENFAPTDSIVWTQPKPGTEMFFRTKSTQIWSDFCQHRQSDPGSDPLNGCDIDPQFEVESCPERFVNLLLFIH